MNGLANDGWASSHHSHEIETDEEEITKEEKKQRQRRINIKLWGEFYIKFLKLIQCGV